MSLLSRIVAQVNPFDKGRTFKNPQPQQPQSQQPRINMQQLQQAIQQQRVIQAQQPSLIHTITHNPVTDFIGNQTVKPAQQQAQAFQKLVNAIPEVSAKSPARFLNNAVIRPVKTTDTHAAQALQGHNPYHGSTKEQLGQALQDAINMASVIPVGKGAEALAQGGKVLPRVIKGIRVGAKAGAGFGSAQGVSTALTENQNLPQAAKTIAINTALGTAGGGITGGVLPVAGATGKAVGKATADVVHPKFAGLTKDQVIMDTGKLDILRNALEPVAPSNVSQKQRIINGLHKIKNDHGLDFISGSPAERRQRIGQFLEQNGEAIPEYQQWLMRPKLKEETGSVGNVAAKREETTNPHQYLQEQIQAQETARKAGQPKGLARIKAPISDAKAKLVDSLAPIEGTLNKPVTAENAATHITPQLDRVLRADTIGAQYIKDKGLAKIIQSAPSTKELDQYLIAKHAADLEKNGIKTGRNLAADEQLVNHLAEHYEPHAQALKQYSQGLLDTATDYGLISKELATHLKEKYPNYVPVNRIFGEGELTGPPKGVGGGKASIGQQTVVQRIKGSERAIESPLSSLVDKSIQVVKEGERNKAAQILTGYKDLPGNPFQLRELGKDETIGTKPVISVLDNGVTRRFETTPEIAAAAKSLNKEQLGLVGRILSVPTRVLRLGATGLNPAFTLANVTKDTVSAFINSSHPLRSSVANPKVFVDALVTSVNHGSERYGELVREGAGGTSFDIARNAPVENVRSIRAAKNVQSQVLYTVKHPSELFRALENTIGRSEEFNRALQYYGNKDAALKGGASTEHAQVIGAHAARNNTVNFARAGDYGRVANSVLPYLNAGIQGSRTLLRNLKERPAQTTAKLAVTAFFPTAVITAWNTSDPERKAAYDDIKPYEKQGSFIIVPPHPVKDDNGKWNVIKIPMSQEIANLNDIVRQGVETAVGDGSIKLADVLGNVVGTATSLNAQSPRQAIGQVIPQALKPGIEALTNQNLFTGNKIVPDSQKNLPAPDQIGKSTSGTATELGKILKLSPRGIDNFISTTSGGLGQNLVNLSDKGLGAAGVIQPDQVKGKSFGASIVGRFKGAQGQTQYDISDKNFDKLSKQLQSLPGYKSMTPEDKSKALNRLQSQVSNTYVPKKNSDGSQKPLSSRQQDILNGKPDLNSYLTAQTGSTTKEYNKSPDAEYKAAQTKYNQDKKAGTLNQAQEIKAQNNLNRLKVGSTFDKNIRDLYGLSKTQVYDFITTDQNGKTIADKLNQYDQALVSAGIISKPKFAKGFVSASSASKGSKVKVAKLKLGPLPKTPKVKTPKISVGKSRAKKIGFKKTPAAKKQKAIKIG